MSQLAKLFSPTLLAVVMTKPRKKPNAKFHAFLVEPTPGFKPKNWRTNPEHYRILHYVGPKLFKGSVDAWKFLHNHDEMKKEEITQWAIFLDFDASIFQSQSAPKVAAVSRLPIDVSRQSLAVV